MENWWLQWSWMKALWLIMWLKFGKRRSQLWPWLRMQRLLTILSSDLKLLKTDWVLQNGPWCYRGYTLVLQAWAPRMVGPVVIHQLRLWMQIYNLPQEYFSTENGNLLGSLAGKVVRVDLENDKPALWLRVLVDIEYKKLLVSGCFFDLASGEKQWLQFKFEKVGIFCYNYGVLGHQHKGCNLTTPVMIVDKEDKSFPMFGPWLSPSSAYADVFSGPKMNDVRGLLATNPGMKLRVFTPVKAIDGSGGDRLKGPGILSTRLPRR
ncbi:hypothetical protein G4B88_013169 [Cannabis sativa]|uniref:Zinc knuckle CX2CX4HX4C domain-containing protein n=1 Tax=Cannabis sativa TaxID=3483 RepID=A0A7J6GZD3_CANSA|nr:hypothetical protein G4B88_013169 [Cannabis sativa]